MDEEDVRYEVFKTIYDMIYDNISLRVKMNKLSGRILNQASLNVDKTVANYFRKKHQALFGFSSL